MYRHGQGGGGRLSTAFTMAEILLSLTIIGVVAAITLPSLTGNINERTWNTQRKALYARFSQAISLMPSLGGYGSNDDNAAETFVTAGLAKVLEINNICDYQHVHDCGIPKKIATLNGNEFSQDKLQDLVGLNPKFNGSFGSGIDYSVTTPANTKTAAFETKNGESVLVYYYPKCVYNEVATYKGANANYLGIARFDLWNRMCVNFLYDLNGNKGPNTFGKDIGVLTAFYPTDSQIVAPMPLATNAANRVTIDQMNAKCVAQDADSRVPSLEELGSIVINQYLTDMTSTTNGTGYWSSTRAGAGLAYRISVENGGIEARGNGDGSGNPTFSVRCIKRN